MKTKAILLILLLSSLAFVFLRLTDTENNNLTSIVVEPEISEHSSEVKIVVKEDSFLVKEEVEESELESDDDFSESVECKKFKNQNEDQYREHQELIEQIGLSRNELMNETAFNTLSDKSLHDLAFSGNHKAKYVLGVTHIWQGGFGIDYFAMSREQDEAEEEKQLRLERIRNHQLNLDQVIKGQELLFEASINGKYFGLIELFNGQGFIINKFSKQKDKTKLKSELIKYLNIVELIDYVFEKESKILMLSDTYFRKDKALDSILNSYGEYLDALQINPEDLIKESDGSQLIERWKRSRLEAGYLETKFIVEERVSDFATELRNVCGLWS